MSRGLLNRVCGMTPIMLSGLALALIGLVVAIGWERTLEDEGAAAHLVQLLMIIQAPIVVLYLATADWRRFRQVGGTLALQAAAFGAAVGSVALFRL